MKHSSIFPLPPKKNKKQKLAATQNFGKVAVPGVTGSDRCFCQSLPGLLSGLGLTGLFGDFVKKHVETRWN